MDNLEIQDLQQITDCDPCEAIEVLTSDLLKVADDICDATRRISINEQNIVLNYEDIQKANQSIDEIEKAYLTGVTLNDVSGVVIDRVAYLTAPTQDALSALVFQNRDNISALTEELNIFEENVADDILNVSGAVDDLNDSVSTLSEEVNEIVNNYVSGVSVYSSNSSVTVTSTLTQHGASFDLSILTPAIIDYLYDLLNYTYYYSASKTDITIDITKALSGSSTATLSAKRYRGLDYPTYTPTSPEVIGITDSKSSSSGWSKKSNSQWTYVYTITDKKQHTASIPSFVATITNSDGESGKTNSVTPSITIKKPFIIIEGATKPTNVDSYLQNLSTANFHGVGDYKETKEMKFVIKTQNDFFYILAPSNKSISYTQNNASQIEDNGTIETIYGLYNVSKSKMTQSKGDIIGVLTIS